VAVPVRLIPIVPKGPVHTFNVKLLEARMTKLGFDMVHAAATYPPAQTSYRRTGTLGRGWSRRGPYYRGGDLAVEAGNAVRYAGPVMGFLKGEITQRELFRRYGWESIEVIANREVRDARPSLIAIIQGKKS
jgi:hypothetical protein